MSDEEEFFKDKTEEFTLSIKNLMVSCAAFDLAIMMMEKGEVKFSVDGFTKGEFIEIAKSLSKQIKSDLREFGGVDSRITLVNEQ